MPFRLARRTAHRWRNARRIRTLRFEALECRHTLNGVLVIPAPSNIEFVDMGYDVDSDEVGIVGYVVDGSDKTATVFELNAARNGFDSATLADLPGATGKAKVFGISSDGSRIAGVSKSPRSIDVGEGTTWLRSDVSSPVGVGFLPETANTSVMEGVWKDGAVGQSGGGSRASRWSSDLGMQALDGTDVGIGGARDVSSDGRIIVGDSTRDNFNGAAYYWDDAGIHRLNDQVQGQLLFQSIAYAVSPDGNNIGGIVSTFSNELAVVWNRLSGELRVLKDAEGQFFEGVVLDVSNLGYAVGETIDGKGFIWHPSFAKPLIFEDWLAERQPDYSPAVTSFGVVAISEDRVNGKLRFALSDIGAAGASYYAEVDVAEIKLQEPWFSFDGAEISLAENASSVVTLTVVPAVQQRVISLTAVTNDPRLQIPDSIMVPANADQVTFTITAANDFELQGDRTVALNLSSADTLPLSKVVEIRDDEAVAPFRNPMNALDVNPDGQVVPQDVLIVINRLNSFGSGTLVWDGVTIPSAYFDTNGDNFVAPLDALLVINFLNQLAVGEGEPGLAIPFAFLNASDREPAIRGIGETDLRRAAASLPVRSRLDDHFMAPFEAIPPRTAPHGSPLPRKDEVRLLPELVDSALDDVYSIP